MSRLYAEPWWRLSPLCGGAATSLVLLSLLVSVSYSGDTATALLHLHQTVSPPSPLPSPLPSHHHHTPTFLTSHSQSPGRQFWERKVKREESQSQPHFKLMISTLVVWSLLLLLLLLLRNLRRLRLYLRLSHLLVVSLTTALLLKALAGADLTQLWALLTPDLAAVTEIKTWSSALVLAGLSTNLITGAVSSLSRGSRARLPSHTNILAALASHLAVSLVFSLAVLSLMSEGGETAEVQRVFSQSLLPPAWVQTALVLVALLGLHSLLVTVSVSLSFLQQNYPSSPSPARLYPGLLSLLLLTLGLSLLPYWPATAEYSKELVSWAVERFSFLVQAVMVASLVLGVGLDNINQRMASAGGSQLGRFYKYYGGLAPLALLLLTAFLSVQDIDQRDLTVGCSVFLVMTASLFLSSAVLIINKVRSGKQKHLAWRQVWVEEVLGRRSEEVCEDSLTNSYRKFERCDLNNTSIIKIKTNHTCQAHWQYKRKDGRF